MDADQQISKADSKKASIHQKCQNKVQKILESSTWHSIKLKLIKM